jgi:hypothetical protein
MMTEGGSDYPRQTRDTKDSGMHLFLNILIIIILTLFFQNELAAEERLKAGIWKGTFLTHDRIRYKIKSVVSG